MPQNIYDDQTFFEGYLQLPRSILGLGGAPEWPTLQSMLPSLASSRVLDLGCGLGWFVRWAREQGAATALGIDLSERMLEQARARTNDSSIRYLSADLNQIALPAASFELVYSSLALHYLENPLPVFERVHQALAPAGQFVFSVEHPMFTAPRQPEFVVHELGHHTWPVDSYLDEGPRVTNWLADGVVKQHRTVATYVNLLVRAGFAIRRIEEWSASPEQLAAHPQWHRGERERPYFLLIACSR